MFVVVSFMSNVFFTVTLLGAHSLGHTHIANSGYGFVDSSQSATRLNAWDLTPAVLDNGYYNDLVRNVSNNQKK